MWDYKRVAIIVGIVVLCVLVYALRSILMPFVAGALLAYLANPLVLWLGRFGLKRVWAASLTFFVLLIAGIVALLLLVPTIWRQIMYVESRIPAFIAWINETGAPWIEKSLGVSLEKLDMDLVTGWLAGHTQELGNLAKELLPTVAQSGLDIAAYIGLLAMVPVVTFYLLLDWDNLLARIQRLIPRQYEAKTVQLARESDDVLAAFMRGQLLVMLALGIVYATGLSIIGLKLAVIIGLVAGLASIIPYLGFTVGIIAATIAGLFQFGVSVNTVFMVWGVFIVGQAIEGWILQPYLLGDRIGLHPVAVIFAVMAGGVLFGFFGMLLALPVAAVIMVLLGHLHQQYIVSDFYQRPKSDGTDAL